MSVKALSIAKDAMLKKMGIPTVKQAKERLASGEKLNKKERELLERIASGNIPITLGDISPEARKNVSA